MLYPESESTLCKSQSFFLIFPARFSQIASAKTTIPLPDRYKKGNKGAGICKGLKIAWESRNMLEEGNKNVSNGYSHPSAIGA